MPPSPSYFLWSMALVHFCRKTTGGPVRISRLHAAGKRQGIFASPEFYAHTEAFPVASPLKHFFPWLNAQRAGVLFCFFCFFKEPKARHRAPSTYMGLFYVPTLQDTAFVRLLVKKAEVKENVHSMKAKDRKCLFIPVWLLGEIEKQSHIK